MWHQLPLASLLFTMNLGPVWMVSRAPTGKAKYCPLTVEKMSIWIEANVWQALASGYHAKSVVHFCVPRWPNWGGRFGWQSLVWHAKGSIQMHPWSQLIEGTIQVSWAPLGHALAKHWASAANDVYMLKNSLYLSLLLCHSCCLYGKEIYILMCWNVAYVNVMRASVIRFLSGIYEQSLLSLSIHSCLYWTEASLWLYQNYPFEYYTRSGFWCWKSNGRSITKLTKGEH